MANDLERLVVQLSADITRYERALNRANGVTNQRARAMESRFKSLQAQASKSFTDIGGAATRAFAVIGGARGLQTLIDAGIKIDNALKVAGQSGAALESTYRSLRDAALANGAPVESLVQLYGRLSIVQGELGVSGAQIEGFSKNIALALRVGGQSAQEASGALLQLSQALGSGIVRAEEFNSIQEGAPVILQAAAAGIEQAGGSVAKLRKIMLDGQLSSKALFDGFEAGSQILRDRVQGSVFTLGQRFENLQTILIDSARQFEKSSGAANVLGGEIDKLASAIQAFNAGQFVQSIGEVITALETATNRVTGFLQEFGKLSGLGSVGPGVLSALGIPEGGSYLGGAITIRPVEGASNSNVTSQIQARLAANARERANLEREIAELQADANESIREGAAIQQRKLDQLNQEDQRLSSILEKRDAANSRVRNPTLPNLDERGNVVPVKPPEKVDITDAKYRVQDEKEKKARKEKLDDYQREVQRIRERTEALETETEVQGRLNPLVNDYGYAVQFAAAQQELTNAAIQAGRQVTPELEAEIRKLADAYALSGVQAEKLAESQDKIRERQAEILQLQSDVTRGLVDDLIEGKSAADAFAGALKKIANSLLDSAFQQFFNPTSKGGIGGFGGFFSGLFGGFASGGYTGQGGQYEPAGIVHKGEYVVPKSVVDKIGVKNIERAFGGYASGGLVNASLARSSPSSFGGNSGGGIGSITYAPRIDARGADVEAVARLERAIQNDRDQLSSRVIATVQKARASNVRGV